MAKTKTPKSERVVDLKPKADRITEAQLKEIQQVVSASNKIKLEIGNTEAKKHAMLHELDFVNKKIGEIQSKLEEEYGKVDVDISNGAITYSKDGQADS